MGSLIHKKCEAYLDLILQQGKAKKEDKFWAIKHVYKPFLYLYSLQQDAWMSLDKNHYALCIPWLTTYNKNDQKLMHYLIELHQQLLAKCLADLIWAYESQALKLKLHESAVN